MNLFLVVAIDDDDDDGLVYPSTIPIVCSDAVAV